jgi:hypothetical protein
MVHSINVQRTVGQILGIELENQRPLSDRLVYKEYI